MSFWFYIQRRGLTSFYQSYPVAGKWLWGFFRGGGLWQVFFLQTGAKSKVNKASQKKSLEFDLVHWFQNCAQINQRVGGGIFGNGWSTFLLQKRPSPTLLASIYKTRIDFEIESMTNLLQNDLKWKLHLQKTWNWVQFYWQFCVFMFLWFFFQRQGLTSFYQSSPEASKRLGLKWIF